MRLTDCQPSISVLMFSPDGKKLVSGTMEGNIQMWDTETGIGLISLAEQDPDSVKYGVKAAAEAPDATGTTTVFPDATVTYQAPISVLAFSPNGKLFAAGSHRQIRLWNMGTGNWGKGITSINNRKDGGKFFTVLKRWCFHQIIRRLLMATETADSSCGT